MKKGEKVRVIKNTSMHGFKIGQIVEIAEVEHFDGYETELLCVDTETGGSWFMYESDTEKIR